mmetsp:Transcript_46594/g.116522  ORF Transcript_46594/g.116522 Transcript_46594/m.116522 type:complete len:202 (-) Transcript_46594:128-733(-)
MFPRTAPLPATKRSQPKSKRPPSALATSPSSSSLATSKPGAMSPRGTSVAATSARTSSQRLPKRSSSRSSTLRGSWSPPGGATTQHTALLEPLDARRWACCGSSSLAGAAASTCSWNEPSRVVSTGCPHAVKRSATSGRVSSWRAQSVKRPAAVGCRDNWMLGGLPAGPASVVSATGRAASASNPSPDGTMCTVEPSWPGA